MIAGRIEGFTRDLGAPAGWDHDRDGPCGSLAIRDGRVGVAPCMTSVWSPTPDELHRLAGGACVELTVVGRVHPPVALNVGQPPEPVGGGMSSELAAAILQQNIGQPGPWSFDELGAAVVRQAWEVVRAKIAEARP